MSAIPVGYKQTEVGVIPADWEVKRLGQIGSLSKGKGLLKEDISTHGAVPAIPYTALYTDFSEVLDYRLIKWFVDDTTETIVLNEPCVLIASSSNMAENTGKASALIGNTPVAIGREVIVFRSTSSSSYISYLLSTSFYRKKTLVLARGTTIKHLYPATFSDYSISLPPLPEQRAIAAALSDVDALLAKLDQFIAKKRDLKQAAMQQLLTGQTRLPGFSGAWEVLTIEDMEKARLLRLSRGNVISKKDIDRTPGDCPIYSSSVKNNGGFGTYGNYMFEEELITWSVDGGGHFFYRPKHRFSVTNVCGYMRVETKQIHYQYLAVQLQHLHSRMLFDYTTKAHPSVIRKAYAVPLPHLSEQTAIATVLSDMDAELAALEARRDKTRALKQGMMQELLTGRIRLL